MRSVVFALLLLIGLAGVCKVAMAHYFTGKDGEANMTKVMDTMWEVVADDETKDAARANEEAVASAMVFFLEAQQRYREENGRYSHLLSKLDLPREMSEARLENVGCEPYHGYLFALVPKNGTQGMKYRNDFVLCAVPALYPMTGKQTFAMGPKGIVLARDTQGMPVGNATEFTSGGWLPRR